jgi:hypothetical protein
MVRVSALENRVSKLTRAVCVLVALCVVLAMGLGSVLTWVLLTRGPVTGVAAPAPEMPTWAGRPAENSSGAPPIQETRQTEPAEPAPKVSPPARQEREPRAAGTGERLPSPPAPPSASRAAVARTVKEPRPASPVDLKGLTIPREHPRIWWTPERLAQAKRWYARHRFVPKPADPWDNALCYAITHEQRYARNAIDALLGFKIAEDRLQTVASNAYRWTDWVPVVYDWTYDAMTAAEREEVLQRYNHYVDVMTHKHHGRPEMVSNNYNWGSFRNEVNWAVATYYENPAARDFLQFALGRRWQENFVPYAAASGKGGVAPEGSQYGRYMLQYVVVPALTLKSFGRDLFRETDFYKEAVYFLIYWTTPGPTLAPEARPQPYYQVFPFGDDERDGGYPSALASYYGDFMTAAALEWNSVPTGEYARQWLQTVRPPVSKYVAAIDPGGPTRPFEQLPLDYYAPGSGYLFVRNQWSREATSLFSQLGLPVSTHQHLDKGTFQIWRKGRWLSKESTDYGAHGKTGARETINHNGILFGHLGQANAYEDGPPRVLRLESRPEYNYAAIDLSPAYRAHRSPYKKRDDNPYAGRAVRELLFIRPLETLVVLDRLEASGDAMPAEKVEKTFLLHFTHEPQIKAPNAALAVNGDQALQVATLVPGNCEYKVVDESKFEGRHGSPSFYQFRLEVNDRGQAQSYFLHVLHARDAKGADLEARLTDERDAWTVNLKHPTLGNARVVFKKGMDSSGGAFAYSATGVPTSPSPLRKDVQKISVPDNGPVWHE